LRRPVPAHFYLAIYPYLAICPRRGRSSAAVFA